MAEIMVYTPGNDPDMDRYELSLIELYIEHAGCGCSVERAALLAWVAHLAARAGLPVGAWHPWQALPRGQA